MPPLKRFRDMEHLSGGEKTIAALALLFAIHSWHPSPFFVLDEVDAALDNANVARIARYIRGHARPGMQFIVISLKNVLFQMSETLVGIYRDQGANSSKSLTLDVSFSYLFFCAGNVGIAYYFSAAAKVLIRGNGWRQTGTFEFCILGEEASDSTVGFHVILLLVGILGGGFILIM